MIADEEYLVVKLFERGTGARKVGILGKKRGERKGVDKVREGAEMRGVRFGCGMTWHHLVGWSCITCYTKAPCRI